MQDSDAVIAALGAALAAAPDNSILRRHLAEVLVQAKRIPEAEQHLRDCLRRSPHDLAAQAMLVQVYLLLRRAGPALVLAEDLAANPQTSAHHLLQMATWLAEHRHLSEAQALYQEAVKRAPDSANPALAEKLGLGKAAPVVAAHQPGEGAMRQRPQPSAAPTDPDDEADETDAAPRTPASEVQDAGLAELERPKIGFSSVGGMEAVKDDIRLKIIMPMKHPEMYASYGKQAGGGVLLYGPPGCGKTHLARACAGEVGAGFMTIGLHQVLDMWVGQSEKNLHELFAQARRQRPCVLFFDEVDALAASRSDMRQSAGRHLINQFLSELDGIQADNQGLLILAATNAPWHLDNAFRRPGRFDRLIFVPPPDATARAAILEILLRDKPREPQLDLDKLAKQLEEYSGADLKAVVEQAIESKLREAIKTGKILPLSADDLRRAAKTVRASPKEWFGTARNYALYANAGGTYDEILSYLKLRP